MTDFIAHLSSLVAAHAGLAYFAVFLAALSVPVFDSLIPGSTIILAMSPDRRRRTQLFPAMLAAIVEAIIGDGTRSGSGIDPNAKSSGSGPCHSIPGWFAEQNLLQSLWHAGRIPCPHRRTGPHLRAADGRRIPTILLWASAHVLPGALAISALHHYGGLPHNFGKLIWFSAVIVLAAIIGAATWWRYRRRGFNMSATVDKQTG